MKLLEYWLSGFSKKTKDNFHVDYSPNLTTLFPKNSPLSNDFEERMKKHSYREFILDKSKEYYKKINEAFDSLLNTYYEVTGNYRETQIEKTKAGYKVSFI